MCERYPTSKMPLVDLLYPCAAHVGDVLGYDETRVKELTDEAFGRIGDVSFPVDKVVDCLR